MHRRTSEKQSGEVCSGTGEFQVDDICVKAELTVDSGIITRIDFTREGGSEIEGAPKISAMLHNQPVVRALEIRDEHLEAVAESNAPRLVVALLEALHRAVEDCLDEDE